MRCLVTGCAGFIGSNLTDRLLANGHEVVGYDNFSTGRRAFLEQALRSPNFKLIQADMLDENQIRRAAEGVDLAFHLAANADVRYGTQHPYKDLEQNTIATFRLLEALRGSGVKQLMFASTGSIYGEPNIFPTPEDSPFPTQTSFYGASKLAAEGLLEAYCEAFGFQAYIFRFVSILGERYSHGHVFDFYKQLRQEPGRLRVLGDGTQRKSYLYVQDCIDAVLLAIEKAGDRVNIFNLGVDDYCTVSTSIGWICDYLGLRPDIVYSGGNRGWIGDNPFIFLDTSRISALDWSPKLSIREGVIRTLQYLEQHPWLLEGD
jgi:UDP-glucose 4-epimerase